VTAPDRTPDADPRPWERPGAVRRDVAPHRSNVLVLLGWVGLFLGLAGFCMPPLALAGLLLSEMTGIQALRDIRQMRAGTMDPAGMAEAKRAERLAYLGFIVGLAGGSCGVGVAVVTWLPVLWRLL
jgi:hypothetical protein